LAGAFLVALVGLAPVQAVAPVADPLATTVTGACYSGPGRVSLRVHPPAPDGSYQVQTTARGLEEGSRWVVHLEEADDGEHKRFRRVAVDGSWTVTTRFPGPAHEDDEALFAVSALERGDRSHGCFLYNLPTGPVFGLSLCNYHEWFIAMLTRELDDGSTLVRSSISPTTSRRLDPHWHLKLTATGAASRQVVEFDDRPGKHGNVGSRVVITGVKDPRLRLVATPDTKAPCRIGLNPPNVTTDAPLKLDGLLKPRTLLN
jgi:hypothetical protein